MELTKFRVQNFRNIHDSGLIELNRVTAFVGQNECGKSNLFEALYLPLNLFEKEAAYNINEDWPADDWGNQDEDSIVCEVSFTISNQEHLIEGRSEQDVLYELLLKRDVDLAAPIETRQIKTTEHTEYAENMIKKPSVSSVYSVVKNLYSIGYGVLFACLDESITHEQVEDVAQAIIDWHAEPASSSETHVFFRDSAFRDDVSKTNMDAILEQNGITHVRSL